MVSPGYITDESSRLTILPVVSGFILPADCISIKSISVLDTDDDNKYKRIRRIIDTPVVTEDTNP